MNPKIKQMAEEAGFVFWQNESWGPGPGHIDWSCIYDKEFQKYTELLIEECAKVSADYVDGSKPLSISLAIKRHFGIK